MPELPEVETVCRGLAPHMEGKILNHVAQNRPDLRFPFPTDFPLRLQGQKVARIHRRAKYMLAEMESGLTLMVHLGMSGRFTIHPAGESAEGPGIASSGQAGRGHNSGWLKAEKHDHVVLTLEDGTAIVYNDPRRFGFMDLIEAGALDQHPSLAPLGPEPLSEEFSAQHLKTAWAGRKSNVKTSLLDQKIVAGLGNIYVCEALWRAGISPKKLAGSVSMAKLKELLPHIKEILAEAIEAGGSSLKDFRQADGELGYFQHSFDAYDREGEACRREGCKGVIKRIVQSNRSTFYCPTHQR